MRLYDTKTAPNPRRTRIFLAEKGITVPTEQVDMVAFQHKTPEYTAINPLQRMPALVLDDGTVITESIAICRYFEVLQPEPGVVDLAEAGRIVGGGAGLVPAGVDGAAVMRLLADVGAALGASAGAIRVVTDAGWMSYDVGLQPNAQKYFVLALHAAKESGDRPLGAFVLSAMSRQMIHLGRPDDALELLHLAQYGSRDSATATTQSMLYALEARAYAAMGQAQKCHRAVRMAEDAFGESRPAEDPDWIRFFSEAELNAENAHSYRDLAYVAGRSHTYASLARPVMERAVELFAADPEHQRSYALNLVGMATVHLLERNPEPACESAHQAIDVARKVRSERVNTRIRKTADSALRDHGDVAEVVALSERLATDLPETCGPQGGVPQAV